MPKWLDIPLRILLVSAFFLGLFWRVRMESAWRVVSGVALMALAVRVYLWLFDRTHAPGEK